VPPLVDTDLSYLSTFYRLHYIPLQIDELSGEFKLLRPWPREWNRVLTKNLATTKHEDAVTLLWFG
jgi:hypothetical protein